jgi:hypothetical protein
MCPVLTPNVAQMFTPTTHKSDAMRQFELNLTPRTEHHGSIEPWIYKFQTGTLLEELDTRRHVYGLWDKLFGCWKIDTTSHESHEIIPTWIPLNSRGIWRDPLDIRFENAPKASWLLSAKWRYEANAAFAAYFSNIPHRIRSVVAPLDRHQWLGLDLIWQIPEFAYFLDEEIFNGSQQYVFACLALSNAETLSRTARRDLAKTIMTSRRAGLLSDLAAIPNSKKILRLLNKLGDQPCQPGTYLGLMKFLNEAPSSKELLHADTINLNAVDLLNGFPSGFVTPNFVRFVLEDPDECEILCSYDDYEAGSGFRTVVDIFPELSPDWKTRIRTSLGSVRNGNTLPDWGERWAQRLTEVIQFPSPPFLATQHLIPLATAKAVRQESQAMQNCVSRMISRVMAGEIYFYNWDGPEPATVMIEKSSDSSWRFEEAHGFNNQPLHSQTVNYIENIIEVALERISLSSS